MESNKESLQRHFYIALGLALGLRLVCLHFVWGPQALDDYLDNIIPAWRYIHGADSGLHDYRSPLYLFILAGWLKIGLGIGLTEAISQIQWVYLLQGTCSLLCVVAIYEWVKNWSDQRAASWALYLVAAHGILPFASTRSFMESFAMGFLSLGLVLLAKNETEKKFLSKNLWWGWILVGFATLVRFQIGIIAVGWGAFVLLRRRWNVVLQGIIIGSILILAEALIDQSFGRYPFQTLHDYFAYNSDQTRAAVMPWYNTWLTWLGGLFFPFAFVMGRNWWKSIKENWTLFFPILLYVIVHSLYPHKEERYLYPILPLSMVFLARTCSLSIQDALYRWMFRPAFWLINTLALLITCLVNTQIPLVGIYGEMQRVSDQVLYLDYDHLLTRDWVSEFFRRPPAKLVHPEQAPNIESVENIWSQNPQLPKILLMSSDQKYASQFLAAHMDLSKMHKCSEVQEAGTITDRILFLMNPKFNDRRKPTQYFSCDQ